MIKLNLPSPLSFVFYCIFLYATCVCALFQFFAVSNRWLSIKKVEINMHMVSFSNISFFAVKVMLNTERGVYQELKNYMTFVDI